MLEGLPGFWMPLSNLCLKPPDDDDGNRYQGYYEIDEWGPSRAGIRNATAAFSSSNNAGNRLPPVVISCVPNSCFDNLITLPMWPRKRRDIN